jgi:hypothetical protein
VIGEMTVSIRMGWANYPWWRLSLAANGHGGGEAALTNVLSRRDTVLVLHGRGGVQAAVESLGREMRPSV